MRFLLLISLFFMGFYLHAQDLNYSFDLLDKNLTKNANAVVRFDEMTIDLESKKQLNITRKKAVTVLNEKGSKHAMAYVGYDNNRKVKDIQVIIYDASGKELDKIKEKKFKDVSAVDGSTLYSDSRYKYYHYTPVQYPYTLELTYEVSTENTGEIPPAWYFLNDFMVSTEKSNVRINFSTADLKPILKEKNLEGVEISKKETFNSILYEAKNIGALKEESLSPTFRQVVPQLLIRPVHFNYEGYDATVNDWNDLGKWMYGNLLKDRGELPMATKSKVKAMVEGVDDDLEKAKIIYKYVQNNTRYISVQVGIGGIQPIEAIEVDRVKYGDCKGLSNYTKALLEAVGVKAYYTHVEAGKDKIDFEEDFPDLAQGNHVILAIPYQGQYYWIDCTSQVHPFGFVGDFTDDRKVLIIKPDGGEIVSTPSYTNEQNQQLTEGTYTLHESGSITGSVTIHTKGIQYDNHFGLKEQPQDNIEKYYKNYWDNINNLNIKTYKFQNDSDTVAFTEQVAVDATNYASKSGTRLLFAANAFNKNKYVPNRYRNRKLPFEIQRGFLDEDKFTIEIPEGYIIEAIPEAVSIENKFGTYAIDFEEADGKILLKRKFFIKQGHYPNTEYTAYRDFMKAVTKFDGSKIVIKSIL